MKKILKFAGLGILALVVIVAIAAFALSSKSQSNFEQTFDVEPELTSVSPDSAALALGEHVMEITACQHCHGERLEGSVMMDMPLWRMTAANLTSGKGGIGGEYSVADWDRAIRSAVGPDGHALMIMPSEVYKNLSNEDTEALIAYLQSIDPVDNEMPASELRFMGGVMLGMGGFDIADIVHEPGQGPEMTPPREPNATFGAYLASTSCVGCHGDDLAGKENTGDPSCPDNPSLAMSADWELDQFMTTMRSGVLPDGRQMIDKCMPWSSFGRMTDVELEAVLKHIRSVTT